MNSSWRHEILAVLRKEWQSELRSKAGFTTSALFSVVTVVAISLASYNRKLDGSLAAGLFWVAVLFSATVSLPRIFLAEEESNTMDILRLLGRPHAIFWGKSLFTLGQTLFTAVFLSALFLIFVHQAVQIPWLFAVTLVGGCASLSGAVTLCGALVAPALNRSALAAAIAIPLLLPVIAMCVTGMRVSLGSGFIQGGNAAAIGLLGYAAASLAIGPNIFAFVWKS